MTDPTPQRCCYVCRHSRIDRDQYRICEVTQKPVLIYWGCDGFESTVPGVVNHPDSDRLDWLEHEMHTTLGFGSMASLLNAEIHLDKPLRPAIDRRMQAIENGVADRPEDFEQDEP